MGMLRQFAWVTCALFAMWSAAIVGAQQQDRARALIAELTGERIATTPPVVAQENAIPVPAPRPYVKLAQNEETIPPEPPASAGPITNETADAVAQRLRMKVPAELMGYFNVYLYVSKAAEGQWAQHMFVFHKDDIGDLVYEKSFPVSTGRERWERYFTSTPVGIFQLDPHRFAERHWSRTWRAPMPWAMFLNYTKRGRLTGIALHSASSHVKELGHRASGGCVRLPHELAQELFERFKREDYGPVPVFRVDSEGSTSRSGEILRTASGKPVMTMGYRVLLFIEDYPGGPTTVAVLS